METKFMSETNLNFLLYDVFDLESLTGYELYSQHNKESFDMVLDSCLKLAKNKMRPILEEMDQKRPELVSGEVKVHPEVGNIMKACGEGGWIGASFSEEFGGIQLPVMVIGCIQYLFSAANFSAWAYCYLNAGVARLIITFGSENLIDKYVPQMLEGTWQGTMALTEPQAGSSLADLTTAAIPAPDGTYRMRGQKIFISAGDHDGVDNVVHLLLAKIEGAPAGVKGISLFLVPKKRIDENGDLVSNDIEVTQIYHKLGYRGCPITALNLGESDDCHGYLVGQPNKGLSHMFQMINESRLAVGIEAAATASAAYYVALQYAKERTQGRKIGDKDFSLPQVPIIEHADVKRMLLFQRAVAEGSLALVLQCGKYADLEKTLEGEEKEKNSLLLDVLVPVAKSYPSEMGILATSQAIQCLGGSGYCEDFPVELYFRDSRIHPIHEGTTGIQGMDLLGRKVTMQNGKAFELYTAEVRETIRSARDLPELSSYADRLEKALEELQEITQEKIALAAEKGQEVFLADATIYLDYFGIIAVAWQWLLQAIVATKQLKKAGSAKADFLEGKLLTCRYFFAYELPKIKGLAARLKDTDYVTVDMDVSHFND